MKSLSLNPIGHVRSTRKNPEDDNWDSEKASIELDPAQFSEEALLGLSEFSHTEIIFYMDKVAPSKIQKTARHPRNNAAWPMVGIFAQRGKNRPNQIGTTICKILNVEGLVLHLQGLDAIDGTPVLDIKPWVIEFAPRGPIFQPNWISELMRGYWQS
jgi:tRNA-Thr(GGU) m(6)t(6)A37 methyltransferase TsaA